MFERYTECARRCIFFARSEAAAARSRYIETEHFLLGILRENQSIVQDLLSPGFTLEAVRDEFCGDPSGRISISASVDLPLSDAMKQVLTKAAEDAEDLERRYIGVEHLLLAVLGEKATKAAQVMQKYGLDRDRLWAEVAQGRVVDPTAPSDREYLHKLLDGLPAGRLEEAVEALQRLNDSIESRVLRRRPGVPLSRGHSSSRVEHGVTINETRRSYEGHEILVVERFFLSDDGSKLNYVQDVIGPKQERRQEIEFDLT